MTASSIPSALSREVEREPETVTALRRACHRTFDGTWRFDGINSMSVVVRRLTSPAAWSVTIYSCGMRLASAEGESIEDAEAACAMAFAFVLDAGRQFLDHVDGGVAARLRAGGAT